MHVPQQAASGAPVPLASNNTIPIFCSLHGKQLDFLCLDCNQRICLDCLGPGQQHQGHRFDFFTSFHSANQENLDFIRQRARVLHCQRRDIVDGSYRQFKTNIRAEVLALKEKNVRAIEDAASRILQLINKAEMRNFEREMEIYQNFVKNKIVNFLHV